jgi:hypothetical protein
MSGPIATTACSSEKSLPEKGENDVELIDLEHDMRQIEKPETVAISASGDRALVSMDLDSGLVGWESDSDPDNPQ